MGDKFFMYFRLLRGKTLVLWITNLITNLSCVKQESNWEEHRFEVNGAHHFCLFYMIFQNNIPSPQPLLPPFPCRAGGTRPTTWAKRCVRRKVCLEEAHLRTPIVVRPFTPPTSL